MPHPAVLSDVAASHLETFIDTDLLGTSAPCVKFHSLMDDQDLLNSADFMAPYLTERLRARGLQLEVREVERYYFDFDGLGPVLGGICYLGLYDLVNGTRRLFIFGAYNPGMEWKPEQTSGPHFEKARAFVLGSIRQREFRAQQPDALRHFMAPMVAKVRAYIENRELTVNQQHDLKDYLTHDYWNSLNLESLIYIALALGTTLEEILAENPE